MQVVKTVRIPVHFGLTETKQCKLDKLTARLTYAVRLWSELIDKHNVRTRSQLLCLSFCRFVREQTGLSAGFVQQCGDKALWMWRQYWIVQRKWQARVKKTNGKWREKLLSREPSKPFSSQRSLLHKVPVRIDRRTGVIERVGLALTELIVVVSSLKKHDKLVLLLNPSFYHLHLLEKGQIKDFELVKKQGKFFVHVSLVFDVSVQRFNGVRGVDLGVKRSISTVLVDSKPLNHKNFSIVKDVEKIKGLQKLNNRISHLQRMEKFSVLRKLKNKRLNFAADEDRKLAKSFVNEYCQNSYVFIGHPENIRYNHFKGNNNKVGRKILQGWAFFRQAKFIQEKCSEQGIPCQLINEWWTSSKCHKCKSKVKRVSQSRIECPNCGLKYDADFNASLNIAFRGKSLLSDKSFIEKAGAGVDAARTRDDLAEEANEPRTTPLINGSPCL